MCLCFAPMPVGRREKSLNCELETRNFKRKKKTKTLGGRGVLYPLVSLKKKKKKKKDLAKGMGESLDLYK